MRIDPIHLTLGFFLIGESLWSDMVVHTFNNILYLED